jgi:sugar/nucleoside kinase (ribokinase family)
VDVLRPAWEHTGYLLPNDDQIRGVTGRDDLVEAAGVARAAGVGTVIVTTGAEGCVVVDDGGVVRIPAFEVPVVDTTGCGDAFTAGLLVGLGSGRALGDAARLGTAAAALVAQGLGSDAGIVDLPSTLAFGAVA